VDDIEHEIFNEILPHKPLEAVLPHWRHWSAVFQGFLPDSLYKSIMLSAVRTGKSVQEKMAKRDGQQ